MVAVVLGAAEPGVRSFDIPAGPAEQALKAYSAQSGQEVLFATATTSKVRTNPVRGNYSPDEALGQLLKGTGLMFTRDAASGTLSITRDPNGSRAAVLPAARPADNGRKADEVKPGDIVTLERFEVLGYADSFAQALEKKRATNQIYDSVVAEDIGKLPDTNVADALQRLPGVQIMRDDFGQGGSVAVRGTVNNRVEINGRTLLGTDANVRTAEFVDLPPELFERLEVFKSPTADMVEGSLGATIRLSTRKPLSRKEPLLVALNAQLSRYDLISSRYPKGSLTAGYNWKHTKLGDFGFLTTATYQDQKVRADRFATLLWNDLAGTAPGTTAAIFRRFYIYDVNKDGVINQNDPRYPDRYYVPARLGMTAQDRRVKNAGWESTLQWKPSEHWEFRLETNLTDSQTNLSGTQFNLNINGGSPDPAFAPVFSDNGAMLRGRITNVAVLVQPQPNRNLLERDTYTAEVIAAYDNRDRLRGQLRVAYAKGTNSASQYNFRNRYTGPATTVLFDFAGRDTLPTIEFGQNFYDQIKNPANYAINQWTFLNTANYNAEKAVQADLDYRLRKGLLTSIESGARYDERSANRRRAQAQGFTGAVPASAVPQYLRPPPFANIGGGIPGADVFPGSYLATTGSSFQQFVDAFKAANGLSPSEALTTDNAFPFRITEKNLAAYIKANFAGRLANSLYYTGNLGVREVQTKTSSRGFLYFATRAPAARAEGRDYTKTLPSMNLSVGLKDNLFLRTAMAGVMARPNLSQLSTSTTLSPAEASVDGVPRGNGGNPDLKPYAATQYDVSLEWYVGKGGLLSVAGFLKDIKASILTASRFETYDVGSGPIEYLVQRPANGPATKVKGAEFTAQQIFSFLPSPFDGLGINASYTHTIDSEQSRDFDHDPVPLEGLSGNSYNVVVFYEKRGLGVRAAYNYRSSFVTETSSSNGRPLFRKDVGQLDLSAYYQINKFLTLTLGAVNVKPENVENYNKITERVDTVSNVGTSLYAGIRVKY